MRRQQQGWQQACQQRAGASRGAGVRRGAWAFSAAALLAVSAGWADPMVVAVFEKAPAGKVLADANDAGLARALSMLPARLDELLTEVDADEPEMARNALRTVMAGVSGPMHVAVLHDTNVTGGLFGYGVIARVALPDGEHADWLHGLVVGGLTAQAQNGAFTLTDSSSRPGLKEVQTPFATFRFGPTQVNGAWVYEVLAGTVNITDWPRAERPSGLPDGVQEHIAFSMDLEGLTPAAQMGGTMARGAFPQITKIIGRANELGLLGENAIRGRTMMGVAGGGLYSRSELEGVGPIMNAMGFPAAPIDMSVLRAIPSDARAVIVQRNGTFGANPFGDIELPTGMTIGQMTSANFEQVKAMTGIDITEIASYFGDTAVSYISDTTGGGSVLSGVALMSVKDAAGLRKAEAQVLAAAEKGLAAFGPQAKRVGVREWTQEGVTFHTLRVSGVPVPLEPTYVVTDDWFILSLSPAGALAAARQATGRGDGGLPANPRFAEAFKAADGPVWSMGFVDSYATIPGGYALVSRVGSAIANGVRSGLGDDRDPGLVVPPMGDLRDGVRPLLWYVQFDGDSMTTVSTGDGSLLANAAATIGSVQELVPFVAGAALGGALGSDALDDVMDRMGGGDDWEYEEEFEEDEGDGGMEEENPMTVPW